MPQGFTRPTTTREEGDRVDQATNSAAVKGQSGRCRGVSSSSVDRLPAQQEMAGCGGCSDSEMDYVISTRLRPRC